MSSSWLTDPGHPGEPIGMEVGAQKTAVKSPVNGMACLLAAVDLFQDNARIDDASNGSILSCHMK